MCVRACVRACVRECVRACVRACVRVCARARARSNGSRSVTEIQIISGVSSPAQIKKTKSFESRRNSSVFLLLFFVFFLLFVFFFLFLPGLDAPHVYVRVWTLCCFDSLISTQIFRRALTASVDTYREIKSLEEDGGKRCPEC